jgi:hypothetical protein
MNIMTWFDARECKYLPKHFKVASTPLTEESKEWVNENLQGRFFTRISPSSTFIFDTKLEIYFEDPKELVLYELRWS